jgi:hypothetical protein
LLSHVVSFEESDDKVTFVLVIDGLKVERNLLKGLNKQPKNALLLNQIINEQSINIALELKTDRKIYRFEIKRLPTQINPDRTKLKVGLVRCLSIFFFRFSFSNFGLILV